MNMHQTDITARLRRFLDRRTMPKALEGKSQAIADEMAAMTAAINRYAPKGDGFADWWGFFEERLGEGNTTRAWPTEGEIKTAARELAGPNTKRPSEGNEIDPMQIAAAKIEAGHAVGDTYLFGASAEAMIRAGLVSEGDLRPYRSALYFAEKETVGEATAKAREAERIARHEDALLRRGTDAVPMAIPDKRMPIGDYRNEPF